MTRKAWIAGVAVIAALGWSGDSAAQVPVQSGGTLARTPSYSSLTTALGAISAATDRINTRTVSASDIRVVDVTIVVGSDNDEPIRKALEQSVVQIQLLRAAIAKNQAYLSALSAHKDKPEARDVIAVDILNSGDVLVYFRKGNGKTGA